ncbi:Arf-GAP with coiled-coil, ANK repeat and PH domain-containing protein 2, variant 4 [Bonamia ostreae]|uniref:Arf-GAP with coiled-coil, ANK repeat and PH domain-containing protein 2, variant 4 n=1 Tax=Bonamia ostreae TaxID=126728 RepID=A0ABV2AMZ9_9EUKA
MDPKKPLNIADKKRLEINSDSVTSYIRNTKMFGGQASIKAISEFPGNDICADCRRKENEWVSLKIGIFICIDCARIHKTLGKEFAEVQSIKHDAVIWDLEKIQFLEAAGNLMMNNIYEHRLPSYYLTPNELIDSPFVRKNFISVKYLEKLFLKTDRNLHENEINEKDHLVVEGCPFYKMPQNPLTFEGEYRSEKKQKGSKASMILINSILSVYKSEKDKNPKATIEIEKAKIDLTNRIVKGLQEYSIKVASKDKCHFFDMRETSGIIDIVHSMRRASAFYSTNPNQKLSNILPKNMVNLQF